MCDAGEQDQRPRFSLFLALGAEEVERLVERGCALAGAASLVDGVRPADKQVGPPRIIGRGELKRAGEPRLRLGGVKAERPLARKREEPPSRPAELVRLLRVAGGLDELECLQ